MSKEILEKNTGVEYITKEKLIETIKASKGESHEQKTTDLTSGLIENHTSEIIEKMESKIPTYVKFYSDLYGKYLSIMNNFCNTCYLNQRGIFDKTGVNDAALTMFDAYLRSVKQMALLQIDLNENMIKNYVEFRLTALDFYDQMINNNITNFSKMLSKFDDFNNS